MTRESQVAQATAYVQSRFFPPLPPMYGELAVTAVEECQEYGPDSHVNLPDDLPLLPRQARRDLDGDLYVTAGELLTILRLDHLIEEED